MVLSQAGGIDKVCFFFGIGSSAVCGFGLPLYGFLFGSIADDFAGNIDSTILDKLRQMALIITVIGAAVGVLGYFSFTFLVIASEKIGSKT